MLRAEPSTESVVTRFVSAVAVGYLGVSVLLRLGWVVVALGDLGFADAKNLTFALESSVLLLLTYDVHPRLTNSIDAADHDFFERDRGIRLLFLVTVAVLAVPFMAISNAHLPHALESVVHHAFPGVREVLVALILTMLGLGGLMGVYLYAREPGPDGVVCRVVRTLAHTGSDPMRYHVDRVVSTFAADRLTPFVLYSRFVTLLAVGAVLTLIAGTMAVMALGVFTVPRLLVLIVVVWLLRDLVRRQFDLDEGLRHLLWEVSEEVEAPKEWFLSMDVVDLGLKGVIALFYLGIATLFAAAILSFFLEFAVEIGRQLPTGLEAVQTLLFEVDPARFPAYRNRVVVVGAVVLSAGLHIVLPFLWGGYLLIVWYGLIDRLDAWARAFPEVGDAAVEVRPLPWRVDVVLPLISLMYPLLVGGWYVTLEVEYTYAVARSWVLYVTTLASLLALNAASFVRGLRRRAAVRVPMSHVARDNHRIVGFIVLFLSGFALVTPGEAHLVEPDLLAPLPLVVAAYYLRDVDYWLTDHATGYYLMAFLQLTYVAGLVVVCVVTIGLVYPAAWPVAAWVAVAIPVLYLDFFIRYHTDDLDFDEVPDAPDAEG